MTLLHNILLLPRRNDNTLCSEQHGRHLACCIFKWIFFNVLWNAKIAIKFPRNVLWMVLLMQSRDICIQNCTIVLEELVMCLPNFKDTPSFKLLISRLWDFTISCDKTCYRIMKRGTKPSAGTAITCKSSEPPREKLILILSIFFKFHIRKGSALEGGY